MKAKAKHSVCHCKLLSNQLMRITSEISSEDRDCASVRAASRNSGKTNNSFTCVVADSGITACLQHPRVSTCL